jgi:hypothetical protein
VEPLRNQNTNKNPNSTFNEGEPEIKGGAIINSNNQMSHRLINTSIVTMGTDNSEFNVKEQFPLPLLATDRTNVGKAPKP